MVTPASPLDSALNLSTAGVWLPGGDDSSTSSHSEPQRSTITNNPPSRMLPVPTPTGSSTFIANAELLNPPSPMEAMLDISDFFDSVGLDFEYGFDFFGPGDHVPAGLSSATENASTGEPGQQENNEIPNSGSNLEEPLAEHLCKCIPDGDTGEDDFCELKPISQPWKVSEPQRLVFQEYLRSYASCLESFRLPSRLSMSRYIAGFVDGYSNHHPFIHMPTFCVTKYQDSPELVLAMMAIGAQFRYESRNGAALYRAGRAIILHRLKSGQFSVQPAAPAVDQESFLAAANTGTDCQSPSARMESIKGILLLATFATWQQDRSLVRESFEYQSLLARCIRESVLTETLANDAVFLSKWLLVLADGPDVGSMHFKERQIIRWLEFIVNEALSSVDEIQDTLQSPDSPITAHSLRFLGNMVIKLFAKMFQRCNSAWPIMRIVGESLHEYSKLLDGISGPDSSTSTGRFSRAVSN
ncbi:hypothetical protein CGCF413_v003992 [Colletotrichum fructicola]|nr:hypothetical protein CFRS1_v010880 [Colletotrichum fructicola]KAF5508033.1 hypothetical protein CGCF413_v003992 [Colletotrichum fructicola]